MCGRRSAFRLHVLAPAALIAASVCAGCSRPPAAAGSAPAAVADPRVTVQQLIKLRSTQKYNELTALVAAPRGRDVVRCLLAVDEFDAANRRLCAWVRDNVGIGLSQTIDQSYVLDDLALYTGDDVGVFSRNIELLDVARDGERAAVAYIATERLPARRVHLRLVEGTWRLEPQAPISEHLPAAFRDMAAALDQVRQHLQRGGIKPAEMQRDPEKLMELVKTRLRRGVALLSKAHGASSQPTE
jgi:hypothetical protein